jgi:hypothetical protein
MQLLTDDASQAFLQLLALYGLAQGLVDQGLVAALACLCFAPPGHLTVKYSTRPVSSMMVTRCFRGAGFRPTRNLLLAQGWTESETLRDYPGLTSQYIQACVEYHK